MAPQTIKVAFNGLTWEENPIKVSQTLPVKHTIATMERKFDTKDMNGFAIGSYVMTYHPGTEDKKCSFVGMQVFDGTLLGKKGSFTCNASGIYECGTVDTKWTIDPDASTGELKGLTGTGWYKVSGHNPGQEVPGELTVEMP